MSIFKKPRFAPAQLDEAYQVVLDQEAWVYAHLHRVWAWQHQAHDSPYKQAMLKAMVTVFRRERSPDCGLATTIYRKPHDGLHILSSAYPIVNEF